MNNKQMIIPSGVTFKFIVTPSLSDDHQNELKFGIIKYGLGDYYKNIDINFYDGYEGNGISDDTLVGKQMLMKIFCPESIITIKEDDEEVFNMEIKSNFSENIIKMIQSNTERKYKAKLEDFLFTVPLFKP